MRGRSRRNDRHDQDRRAQGPRAALAIRATPSQYHWIAPARTAQLATPHDRGDLGTEQRQWQEPVQIAKNRQFHAPRQPLHQSHDARPALRDMPAQTQEVPLRPRTDAPREVPHDRVQAWQVCARPLQEPGRQARREAAPCRRHDLRYYCLPPVPVRHGPRGRPCFRHVARSAPALPRARRCGAQVEWLPRRQAIHATPVPGRAHQALQCWWHPLPRRERAESRGHQGGGASRRQEKRCIERGARRARVDGHWRLLRRSLQAQ